MTSFHPGFLLLVGLAGTNAGAEVLSNSIWARAAARAQVSVETLYAIALQESGLRWPDHRIRPWPWTLNSPAGPMRFAGKAEAQAEFEKLRRAGQTNIDIGMMGINWAAHGRRYARLDLFDPATNLAVSAKILAGTKKATPDLALAIGHYHSPQHGRALEYALRVERWARAIGHHAG